MDNIHHTVGQFFRFDGGVYLCTRYIKSQGYWMRHVERTGDAALIIGRVIGAEACVSERAIGRTYHFLRRPDAPKVHEQPCECFICVTNNPEPPAESFDPPFPSS